jgi:hypothetical protein
VTDFWAPSTRLGGTGRGCAASDDSICGEAGLQDGGGRLVAIDPHFFHYLGLDRDKREQFRGHPYFEKTEEFCRLFDEVAFDRNFKSMPLEAFEPMLQRVFREPRQSMYVAEAAE